MVLMGVVLVSSVFVRSLRTDQHESMIPTALPWQSVGGCGVGIANPSSRIFSAPIWPDELISEYRLTAQGMLGYGFGQNLSDFTFVPRITGFPHRRVLLGVSVPLLRQNGEVQYRANQGPSNRTTGGLGDIAVDGGLLFLPDHPLLVQLSLQFPTGAYDLSRGPEAAEEYLPTYLQLGSGMYALTISVRHERKMLEKGLWNLYTGLVLPFQMRLATGKNEFLDDKFVDYSTETSNKRFYYRFKPYGENDLGRYVPSEFMLSWHYSHLANRILRHTWATQLSFPFGVQWLPSEHTDIYDARPDTDNRMWRSTWLYIPEIRLKGFTAMCFLAIPLNDNANWGNPDDEYDDIPYSQIDGPDWNSFMQQWALGAGFRYSFMKFGNR